MHPTTKMYFNKFELPYWKEEKYKPLIINRLKKFRIQAVNFDDYYQVQLS